MIKTYHLITFGCQMNKSDSERIAAIMENQLNLKAAVLETADLLIFNLCSVRQSAMDRVWGALTKKQKHENTKTQKKRKQTTILTGCILEKDKKKLAHKVDLILNITDLTYWPQIITKARKAGKHPPARQAEACEVLRAGRNHNDETLVSQSDYFTISPRYSSSFSAYVPIMTGCNNFCTYCVVPYTRDREKSRPVEDIINEIQTLIQKGYKEIFLLGQNVNSYKSKIPNSQFLISNQNPNVKCQMSKNLAVIPAKACLVGRQAGIQKKNIAKIITFPNLLQLIDSIPGDYWLSFVTSHPKDMSDELISCFYECRHLMPNLHLPVQSGSDKILKAMNRKYTAQHYLNLIHKIRQTISAISISTDIIVGFPGETEKDFQATAALMKKIKFNMAYLAQYSPRPGTRAAKLSDNVPKAEKKRHEKILNEILKKTALENNKKMVGKNVKVLIETIIPKSGHGSRALPLTNGMVGGGYLLGHTNNMKHVKINLPGACHSRASGNPERKTKNRSGFPIKLGMTNNQSLVGQFVKVQITKAGPWGLEGKLESNL